MRGLRPSSLGAGTRSDKSREWHAGASRLVVNDGPEQEPQPEEQTCLVQATDRGKRRDCQSGIHVVRSQGLILLHAVELFGQRGQAEPGCYRQQARAHRYGTGRKAEAPSRQPWQSSTQQGRKIRRQHRATMVAYPAACHVLSHLQ